MISASSRDRLFAVAVSFSASADSAKRPSAISRKQPALLDEPAASIGTSSLRTMFWSKPSIEWRKR